MKEDSGELENNENCENFITYENILDSLKVIPKENKISPAPKNFVRKKYSCPHAVDVAKLLAGAQKVVDYIYLSDKQDRTQRTMPEEVRDSMHGSSIAALLFRFARSGRQRKPNTAYALIYGKCLTFSSDGTMALIYENITLPQPEIYGEEILKVSFATVYADRVELSCKVLETTFNVSEAPSIEFTGEIAELSDADFPSTAKRKKKGVKKCLTR